MKNRFKNVLVTACSMLMAVSASASMQIEGLISQTDGTIKWIDEHPGDNYIQVPWTHATQLGLTSSDTAYGWCAGVGTRGLGTSNEGKANPGPDRTVTLKRVGGTESVTMKVKYTAAEWLLTEVPKEPFDHPHLAHASAGATQKLTLSGNRAYVENVSSGYMASQCFRFHTRVLGIKSFRPIIELVPESLAEVAEQFVSGALPRGEYIGTANFEANWMHNYYGSSSIPSWTTTVGYRGDLSFTLYFEEDQMRSITVTGEDVIVPDSITRPDYVQGQTEYKVVVEGIISNGVKVSLVNPDSDFSLKPNTTTESETNKIPYSVFCRECDGTGVLMIENGKAVNSSGKYGLVHDNFREVEGNFEVSFTDKLLDELYNDTYLGSFTLLFELDL